MAAEPGNRTRGLVAVVGNPREGSRTAAYARQVLDAVADDVGTVGERTVLDLAALVASIGPPLGRDSGQRYADVLTTLTSARLLVVATPTYKGSYTGLLKSLLDHVAAGALRQAIAVPVMTVGSPAHALAADVHLRPLLLELGAVVPTPALVVTEQALADPEASITEWLQVAGPALRPLLATASRV